MRLRIYCAVLFTTFVQAVTAQTQANLTGRVVDPAGAIVAGASVTATNTDTAIPHTAKSTQAGVYAIPFPAARPIFVANRGAWIQDDGADRPCARSLAVP